MLGYAMVQDSLLDRFSQRVIEAEIITGKAAGDITFIPRIKIVLDKTGLSFPLLQKAVSCPFSICHDHQ